MFEAVSEAPGGRCVLSSSRGSRGAPCLKLFQVLRWSAVFEEVPEASWERAVSEAVPEASGVRCVLSSSSGSRGAQCFTQRLQGSAVFEADPEAPGEGRVCSSSRGSRGALCLQ